MIEFTVYYVIIAIAVALALSAWDNGERWGVGKYLFLGIFWIVSLLVIGVTLLVRKLKS